MTFLSTFQSRRPRFAATLSVLMLYCLLCLPTTLWMIRNEAGSAKVVGYSLVNMCLYCVPVVFLRRHLRWYVRSLSLVAVSIPAVLLAAKFHMDFDHEVVLYALDVGKVGGYAFLGDNLLLLWALPLLVAVVCLCAQLLPTSTSYRQALRISVACTLPMLLLPIGMDKHFSYPVRVGQAISHSYPFNIPRTVAKLLRRQHGIDSYQSSVTSHIGAIRSSTAPKECEIYVFVLGETQRFDRYAINGYTRDTSPNLAKISGLLSFQDVSAPASATARSVPVLLTGATSYQDSVNLRNRLNWVQPPSLQRVMTEANFKTSWIGTLPTVGTALIDAFARDCNDKIIEGDLDGDLIESLRNRFKLAAHQERLFITIHLSGSHSPYGRRYPEAFDRFQPSYMSSYKGPVENLRNSYDNTILYSDFVLSQLISVLEDEDACSFLMFVSDHGENLCDDGGDLRLHGGYPTPYTVHVPLMVWMSDKYKTTFPLIAHNLSSRVEARISGTDVFHSFLDMARVRCDSWDATRSFADRAFRPHSRLVSTDEDTAIDYDKALGYGK